MAILIVILNSCVSQKKFFLPEDYSILRQDKYTVTIQKDSSYSNNKSFNFTIPINPSKYTIVNDELIIVKYKDKRAYVYIFNDCLDLAKNEKELLIEDVLEEINTRTGIKIKQLPFRQHFIQTDTTFILLKLNMKCHFLN